MALTTNLRNLSQMLLVFGIASVVAYAFGFHLLFAHTAYEAFYWAGYYLTTSVLGNFLLNLIKF